MSQDKQFYVYVHRYASGPKQGEVFYVGKGKGKRALSDKGRNTHWNRVKNKYGFQYSILAFFNFAECAFSFERALIAFYGRKNLCNMTDGGDGCVNLPAESRLKMSIAKIGKAPKPMTKEAIHALNERNKIKIHTNIGEVFSSIREARDFLRNNGYPKAVSGNISSCIKGIMNNCYGRTWARIGNDPQSFISKGDRIGRAKSKHVIRSDGLAFGSASRAAKHMSIELGVNASQGNISMVCRGERSIAYGYSWMYSND